MSEPSQAVFLSYASEDAEAAARICNTLRAAGIEVWFDQSELRGGDAWDQSIRKQIKTCALFVPLISKHTHERAEGYFRLEWKLAVDRSYLIAADKAFLVPIVIDDTPDHDQRVPERFRELHWMRLPAGETPLEFVRRIQQLLSGDSGLAAAVLMQKPRITKPALPVAFSPPPRSIAVLAFVNMSGDKAQEYFSDGLTEEVLNSLVEINELQVAARTSAFSFKGTNTDIDTIARKLNVGAILEGSVRRSGNTVRITTHLINAVTGFHLWSHTYDRDLADVLKLQSDIAGAVASALKVNLLGDVTAKIELGGTRNPTAFDAYLRGSKALHTSHEGKDLQTAIAAFTEAIRTDPSYALAFAGRSFALNSYASNFAPGPAIRESYDRACVDAQKVIALAPDLADGHLALAHYFAAGAVDLTRANDQYERALELAPGNAEGLRLSGRFAVSMGRFDAGLTALRRAVVLDPLNPRSHSMLSQALFYARRYEQAVAAAKDALSLDSDDQTAYAYRGLAYYGLGDLEHARASCEAKPDFWLSQHCLAVTYEKLGRHADAEAEVAKLKAAYGDGAAYQYSTIYALRRDTPKALEWLDTAAQLRDPGLVYLKTDPLMDPLRQEPRFQAVMRGLKFPD